MNRAEEEQKENKLFNTIIYALFLAFMCILVFLFTGIITFLSSLIPYKAANYAIIMIGSLILGGMVYSLTSKITASNLRILLAGIICPFTGILNLLLVSRIISDAAAGIKESSAVLLFNASFLNPAAAMPLAAAVIYYIIFNAFFIARISKEKRLFMWYALAPVVFLLAVAAAKAIYEHYISLDKLIF